MYTACVSIGGIAVWKYDKILRVVWDMLYMKGDLKQFCEHHWPQVFRIRNAK